MSARSRGRTTWRREASAGGYRRARRNAADCVDATIVAFSDSLLPAGHGNFDACVQYEPLNRRYWGYFPQIQAPFGVHAERGRWPTERDSGTRRARCVFLSSQKRNGGLPRRQFTRGSQRARNMSAASVTHQWGAVAGSPPPSERCASQHAASPRRPDDAVSRRRPRRASTHTRVSCVGGDTAAQRRSPLAIPSPASRQTAPARAAATADTPAAASSPRRRRRQRRRRRRRRRPL